MFWRAAVCVSILVTPQETVGNGETIGSYAALGVLAKPEPALLTGQVRRRTSRSWP